MAEVTRVQLLQGSDEYEEVEDCKFFPTVLEGPWVCVVNSDLCMHYDGLFQRDSRGFEIQSIEKVSNVELLKQFQRKEEEYEETYGHVRTVKVFHGTKEENISSILKSNFDVNRHGTHIGHRFGAGVSFSALSSYARHYCGYSDIKTMLLCNVLVSEIVEVPEETNPLFVLREPPEIPGREPLRYDTTAKNKSTMDVIVKFHKDTYYPTHVITFKD